MREFIRDTKVISKITNCSCNKCGKQLNPIWDHPYIQYHFGYGSIRDGDKVEFDLCELCLSEYIDTFLIPATITKERQIL